MWGSSEGDERTDARSNCAWGDAKIISRLEEPVQSLFGVAQVSCGDGLLGAARGPHSSKVARAIGKRCNTADRPASHLPEGLE